MKYFKIEDFACKCCGKLPEGGMNPVLLQAIDELQEALYEEDESYDLHIECGYRCPEHNADVGGVPDSQHVLGNAVDCWIDEDVDDLKRVVLEMETFDGVGYYNFEQFCHVDMRSDGLEPNEYYWEG